MGALVTLTALSNYLNVPAGTLRNRASEFDDCYGVSFSGTPKWEIVSI
jgi:hypothetical protein